MATLGPLVITGAGGRLGSALLKIAAETGWQTTGWTRREFDLDDPAPVHARMVSLAPRLVIHAAAWTDVDGCAREPELAERRNGVATGHLAEACATAGSSLILVSTNEVFDGNREDSRPYRADDPVNPANAYGRSKLAGEMAATEAFGRGGHSPGNGTLGIVRTAWLFGAGKPDFPGRIAAAARQASDEGRALRLVADEIGTPTYVPDLAIAILALAQDAFEGVHHVVNGGLASRAEWARDVLARAEIDVPIEEISLSEYVRPSRPPRWGVLQPSPIPGGPLRPWREAMVDRMAIAEVAM